MRKIILSCIIIICLGIIVPSVQAETNGRAEWLIYPESIFQREKVFGRYQPSIVSERSGVIKGLFSSSEINEIHKMGIYAEKNPQKTVAEIDVRDPYLSQQWGLNQIGVFPIWEELTGKGSNLLVEKNIKYDSYLTRYDGGSLMFADTYEVYPEDAQISRISVSLNNVESSWTASILNEAGSIVGSNSGHTNRLDILVPKKKYQKFTLKIELDNAWASNPSLTKLEAVNHVLIAVVDSGIREHEDFCGNILTSLGKDYTVNGNVPPTDELGHGTMVTGVLGACSSNGVGISGVINNLPADILPLKVLNRLGYSDDYTISAAIDDAVSMNADVINLSLAGPGQTLLLENSIHRALLQDIIVVAAAGNGGEEVKNIFPASYMGVLTVAGTTQSGEVLETSNFGKEVEVAAPAENILSTDYMGGYKKASGTSLAAPFVSGTAAILKHRFPNIELGEALNKILHNAVDIGEDGRDVHSGYGLLQVDSAYQGNETSKLFWLSPPDEDSFSEESSEILLASKTYIGFKVKISFNEIKLYEDNIQRTWIEVPLHMNPLKRISEGELVAEVYNKQEELVDKLLLNIHSQRAGDAVFLDVDENYWAFKDIMFAYYSGYINGYTDETFRPSLHISRRHSLMVLQRVFNWELTSEATPFSDISIEAPGGDAVLAGYQHKIIKGYPDQTFRPDSVLTRAQAAVMVARALEIDFNAALPKEPHPFVDLPQGHFAYQAVQALTSQGVFTQQKSFRPNEPMTRAQFAAVISRLKR